MDFNRRVADWVYGLVSKMDDGEARMFTVFLAEDLQRADIANNAKLIERTRVAVEKAMTEELANDFLFRLEHGANPEQLVAEAAAVTIAKRDDPWKFQTRDHGRWSKMGSGYWKAERKAALAAADRDVQLARIKQDYPWRHGDAIAEGGEHLGPQVQDIQQQWNKRSTGQSGATDTFNRINAAGQAASVVGAATGEPNVYAAGQAASLVGQFGPEAEKVVGPAVRRTAYRYRGTETKPEAKEITEAADRVAMTQLAEDMKPQSSLAQPGRRASAHERLDEAKKNYALQQGATAHLATKLPSLALANLQVKSGKIPPSEGVIINDEGKVTAQAVGFAEDHYLPFNLRNLGELNGGRYVRTRTTGGPTSEDIHAAQLSGARSFTVVSRSGEFTVDFADDFRGARRQSDKAMGMKDRYEYLLDAVQSKQVEKLPVSARERAEVREELEEEIERLKADPTSGFDARTYKDEDFNKELNKRLRMRRENPKLSSDEHKRIDEYAWNGLNKDNPTEREQMEHDKAVKQISRRVLRDKGNANFKLDGDGYKAALMALKEQYPYFIADVRVKAAGDAPEDYGEGTDQGYVKPRHIRAEAAQAGYFGAGIEGADKTKRSAENLHYQNWGVRQHMNTAAPTGDTPARETPATTPGTVPATDQPGQATPVTAVGGGGNVRTLPAGSPEEHAELERDDSIYQAGDYWAQRLPLSTDPGYANIPQQLKVLDDLRNAPDPKGFADANQSAIKAAVAHVTAMPQSASALGAAPRIVDNVAAVKHAVQSGNTDTTTPQPLTQDDLSTLIRRGYVTQTQTLGAGMAHGEASEFRNKKDAEIKQAIQLVQSQAKTETSPVDRAKLKETEADLLRLLAFRKYINDKKTAGGTPFSPTQGPPPVTTPPSGTLPPNSGANTYNPNNPTNVYPFKRKSA
jgi:hypothetical protein